jgi:hypothetical protein
VVTVVRRFLQCRIDHTSPDNPRFLFVRGDTLHTRSLNDGYTIQVRCVSLCLFKSFDNSCFALEVSFLYLCLLLCDLSTDFDITTNSKRKRKFSQSVMFRNFRLNDANAVQFTSNYRDITQVVNDSL